MSEYTAEDFKDARFAEHRHGAKAVRWEMNYRVPWHTAIGDRFSDEQMAENGWRPVVEADHPARPLAGYRAQVKELREENDRLERILQAPLSVRDMEVAWENAEQADECREGDTLIEFFAHGAYHVCPAARDHASLPPAARILHRAPQSEPWEALADVLAVEMPGIEDEPRIEALAKALYCEHDVRVTGGDGT